MTALSLRSRDDELIFSTRKSVYQSFVSNNEERSNHPLFCPITSRIGFENLLTASLFLLLPALSVSGDSAT